MAHNIAFENHADTCGKVRNNGWTDLFCAPALFTTSPAPSNIKVTWEETKPWFAPSNLRMGNVNIFHVVLITSKKYKRRFFSTAV